MNQGAGTAIMLAIAALLWVAYLLPSWVRRREYLATERNAVRLQQTLRVMAETADLPDEVRVETSSREIAAQQRALQRQAKLMEQAARERQAATERAARETLQRLQPQVAASVAKRRMRRTRALLTLALLAGVVLGISQLVVMMTGAGSVMSTVLLLAGVCTAAAAVWGHGRVTQAARARSTQVAPVAAPVVSRRMSQPLPEAPVAESREWTPVPLPKPLYLSKPAPQPMMAERDLVAEIKAELAAEAAAKAAEQAAREQAIAAAHAEPEVVPINDEVRSRFARMGIIDEQPVRADIDAALRRRRA